MLRKLANPFSEADETAFLSGGGATGDLIARYPWASTSLGPLSGWPQSLKTITAVMLRSPMSMVLLWGPDGIVIYNDAYAELIGRRHPETLGSKVQESWPDAAELNEQLLRVGREGGSQVLRGVKLTLHRSGGPEQVWLNVDCSAVPAESGRPAGVLVICVDVTAQVRAQAAADDSHRRLSAAIAVARLGVFELDLETMEATLDARAREIFGFGPDDRLTLDDINRRIDEEEYQRLRARAVGPHTQGESRRAGEFHVHLPDGGVRNVVSLTDSIAGRDGRVRRVVGVFDDVTESRAAEQRQRLLNNELNHRVKNTLATVQSIAAQTLRSAPDLPSARDAFETRLVALAGTHNLLTAERWQGARLTDVVGAAMAPFETTHRPQISRSGAPVWLTAMHALSLSLALHELATNAVKYGALSVPDGRVRIRWSVSGEELKLVWTEAGGPRVAAPTRSGFGTRLLQRSLAHELHGDVAVDFAPQGVRCEIRCKVDQVRAPATAQPAAVQ